MKRIFTLTIISILFISMFGIVLPQVKAQETNYSFLFKGTYSGPINDGVFNITSGSITIDSSTYTIVNTSQTGNSGSFITTRPGGLYMENVITLSDGIVGQFDSYTSNYTIYSTFLSITFSQLTFTNSSSGNVLSTTTPYATLEWSSGNSSSFTLIGGNIKPSYLSQSSTSQSAFVSNLVGVIDGTLEFANAILANYVTPGNSTSPATLTPAGLAFVNNIANTINNIVTTASELFNSLANSTNLSTNLIPISGK